MGEEIDQFFGGVVGKRTKGDGVLDGNWVMMEDGEDFEEASSTSSEIESLVESSENSVASSASDMAEEEVSSSSSNSSLSSSGPLYQLSQLMVHLPIKRGLSKHYEGKSQSFTSLANAKSLEDMAKRVVSLSPTRKKMKPLKSYGGGLDGKKYCISRAAIAKKASRGSSLFYQGNKKSCSMDVSGSHRSAYLPVQNDY